MSIKSYFKSNTPYASKITEKLSTVKVAELVQKTIAELANLRKGIVTAEVILFNLIDLKDSIALKIFEEMGLDVDSVRSDLTDKLLNHIIIPSMQLGDRPGCFEIVTGSTKPGARSRRKRASKDG